MEGKNRTIWIVVAVVLAGLLLCCCLLIVTAAATGLLTALPVLPETGIGRVQERLERTFPAGDEASLAVDNFAGGITVQGTEAEQIRVIITRQATSQSELDRITLDLVEQDGGLEIRTSRPGTLVGPATVQIEAFVPAGTELELETNAGAIRIEDIEGEIAARTNAGDVRVTGAIGPVSLRTAAGGIDYSGMPTGRCTFDSGAGSIALRLPSDVDVEVSLDTGIGTIDLGGFEVEGDVSRTAVDGVIGTGADATIDATTGAGSITLVQR